MPEISKFVEHARPDGHDPVFDRLIKDNLPKSALWAGKHAVGDSFDIFCAWVDSDDPDFIHFVTGESDAVIIPFPETDDPPFLAVAGS